MIHLARRFVGSLSRRAPLAGDEGWASAQLLAHELDLWRSMSNVDRRHAIEVARQCERLRGAGRREEMAAALLHDVGKVESGLGTLGRVAATIVGPRTRRFRAYHDHERIGSEWLAAGGSSPVTVDLVRRRGPGADALTRADQV